MRVLPFVSNKYKSQKSTFCEIITLIKIHSVKIYLAGGQREKNFARLLKTGKEFKILHDSKTTPKRLRKFVKDAYGE